MFIVLWKAQRLLWHSTILMIHVNMTSFQRGLSDQQTLGDQRLMLSRRARNLEKISIKIFLIKFYCTPITNSHLNNYEICCKIDCVIGFIDCENHTMNSPVISNKPNVSQETQAQVIFWPQFVPLKPTRLQLIKPNIQSPPKPSEQRVMPHSLPKKEEFSGQTHNPQYLFKNFDPRCNKHV